MKNKLFKILSIASLFLFSLSANAQLYADPTTAWALDNYANRLEEGQEKIEKEQNRLQKAQAFIATQLAAANEIQNKVYKGLTEVSTTLSNGVQIKRIKDDIEECLKYADGIKKMVRKHPQYAPFGAKAAERAKEQILKIIAEIAGAIEGGADKLATAGDRYRLLDNIENQIVGLKLSLISIQLALENVERIGILRALNPFQGYIDTDKDIIENIIRKYKSF